MRIPMGWPPLRMSATRIPHLNPPKLVPGIGLQSARSASREPARAWPTRFSRRRLPPKRRSRPVFAAKRTPPCRRVSCFRGFARGGKELRAFVSDQVDRLRLARHNLFCGLAPPGRGAAEANYEVRVQRLSLASEVSEAEAEWVTRAGLGPHLVTVTRLASACEYDMHV